MSPLPVLLIHSDAVLREALTHFLLTSFPHQLAIQSFGSFLPPLLTGDRPRVIFIGGTGADRCAYPSLASLRASFPSAQIYQILAGPQPASCPKGQGRQKSIPTITSLQDLQHILIPLVGRRDGAGVVKETLNTHQKLSVRRWLRRHRNVTLHHEALTAREREMLVLVAKGLRDKEIAQHCGVSVQYVKNSMHHLSKRLHLLRSIASEPIEDHE